MRRRILIGAAVCFLTVILLSQAVIAAGWVDQWMSHKLVSNPVVIKDESRTIASLGGVSIRWPTPTNEPLVTFSAPGYKAGCGGIDLFFGGMNYVNLKDAFQKKLEMLINSMPAIGLQLALSVFNEPLKNVIQSVQAATDWINGLQQDDCTMAKDIVSSAAAGLGSAVGTVVMSGDSSTMDLTEKAVKDGIADGWGAFKQSNTGSTLGASFRQLYGSATAHEAGQAAVAQCPPIIQALGHTESALLTMIESAGYTTAKGYQPDEIAAVGRALVGDFYTWESIDVSDNAASTFNVKFNPRDPHLTKAESIYTAILTGRISTKAAGTTNGAPIQIITTFTSPGGITYNSIQDFVSQNVNRIVAHMNGNTSIPTGSDEEFLASAIPNTYTLCKAMVMMGVPDTQMVKDMAENEFVYRIIADLGKVIGSGIASVEDRLTAASLGESAGGTCSDKAFLLSSLSHLKTMSDNINSINEVTSTIYYAKLEQTSSVLRNYQVIRGIYSTLVQEGRRSFSDSVMERVTGVGRGI